MPEPFKNFLNASVVAELATCVANAYPTFNRKGFIAKCNSRLEALELKQRADWVGDALWAELPANAEKALAVLKEAINQLPTREEDGSPNGWMLFPINMLIAKRGLLATKASLDLLPDLTKRFTAEFAIRPFLRLEPEATLQAVTDWIRDPDHHVRRLASEGTRPRLPWAEQIPAFIRDPSPIFPILEALKDDPSPYVRRSVANSLNDISKDHPDRMLSVVESWVRDATPNRWQLIRHACRTLVKQGHAGCLKMLGYGAASLRVEEFGTQPAAIALGDTIALTASLHSNSRKTQNLIIDYRFQLVKANGRTAPKVFKGSTLKLPPQSAVRIEKTFRLKPVTTRTYYTGNQGVDLLVNGKSLATCSFHLTVPQTETPPTRD